MTRTNLFLTLLFGISTLFIGGCDLPYYWQAAHGQLNVMQKRQPIENILASKSESELILSKLQYSLKARKFAIEALGLKGNKSYLDYVNLQRDYVTWNVYATPALSMKNNSWCYPIAGCVTYRGYFSEKSALEFADTLNHQGLDTYVSGIRAYSTLGWFDDPILNTFLEQKDALSLAALLFHELAHQTLYVKDDTQFNESYASTIEAILLKQWALKQQQMEEWQQLQHSQQRHQAFLDMIIHNKSQREALFQSELTKDQKTLKKTTLIQQLKIDYIEFKHHWNRYDGYDQWMKNGLNNAQIATVATYFELKPYFLALYQHHGKNIQDFIQACTELAQLNADDRNERLKQALIE